MGRLHYDSWERESPDRTEQLRKKMCIRDSFLVNLYEEHAQTPAILAAYDNIFRTETGKYICKTMFGFSD